MQGKRCSQCHEIKELERFAKLRSASDGRRSYCKVCGRKYATQYRRTHTAKMTAKHRVWRDKHREHVRDYMRDYQRWYRVYGPVEAPVAETTTPNG